jgi:hypothetical protein
VHKEGVLHLRQRRPKVVVEPLRAAEVRKAAVAVAAARRRTHRLPAQRT